MLVTGCVKIHCIDFDDYYSFEGLRISCLIFHTQFCFMNIRTDTSVDSDNYT